MFRRHKGFDVEVKRLLAEMTDPGTRIERLDDDRLQVGDLFIALANLRAKWNQLDQADRLPWLRETLPALVSPPPIPDRLQTTRPLRPGIRPRSMLESARLANLTNEVDPQHFHHRSLIPHQDFGADLVTVLLWDTPATMSVIDGAQLDDWEADFDDLLPVAIDNLDELPESGWTSMYKQVYSSLDEDDYAGARMLRPGYLDSTGLSGELVILHPNRCRLIVAAVDDARGIAKACERVFEEIGAPSPVSLRPLVGRPGNWRPLAVPPSHPAHEMWQRLCHLNDQMIHNSLRQPLQNLLGSDVTIGNYDIVEGADGAYRSVTTWTDGVPSLLPRTELINLVNDWGTVTAPWDEVRQLVGPLIEPTEHYPELWRVVDFPRPQELTKLRHRAGA